MSFHFNVTSCESINMSIHTAQPKSDLWGTPFLLKQRISETLQIKLSEWDPCPYPLPDGFDGLQVDWSQHVDEKEYVFVNPPFSNLLKWAEKAVDMQRKGVNIIFFAAARMDNKCWQNNLIPNASDIHFISPRVRFVMLGDEHGTFHGSSSFPSAIAVLPANYNATGMCVTAHTLRWR